jgi:hypothetical protein
MIPTERMSGKVIQWNYDSILAAGDQKCCFSLTRRDVALIMAISDQMHWKTRYLSPSNAVIDTDLIDAWASGMERRLMDGCCPDGTLSRFTDAGVFQTSIDGGATWQDTLDQDPRNSGVGSPPLGGSGDSTRCAAADNGRDQFKAIRDQMIELLTAGTTVLAVIAGLIGALGILLGLTGAATGIGVLLFGLSAALLALTPESVAEQLDDTVMDQFRCILYCHAEDNGQFTYADWQAVIADVDITFSGFPETFFHSLVAGMGYIGLSNAGTIGTATASDCDDCDCGLDLIWYDQPDQTTSGTVVFQGEGVWRVTLGVAHAFDVDFTLGSFKASDGRCFKITAIDPITGAYSRTYRALCGGGEGYGTIIDVCMTAVVTDRFDAVPLVETVVYDVHAEVC